MVTQAVGGAQRLHHDMPVLADFPCCDIPARAADSKYPPLQWQQRAAKVAVHRAAAHGSWLQVLSPSGPWFNAQLFIRFLEVLCCSMPSEEYKHVAK